MATEISRTEVYENINGETVLKEVIEKEVQVTSSEEIIAEKEAALLLMYAELQALKEKQTN